MATGRRGFLKWLGMSGAAGAASILPTGSVQGDSPTRAFKYWCDCGSEIIAAVPEKVGTTISLACPQCQRQYSMTWTGEGFTVSLTSGQPFQNPFSSSGNSIAPPWQLSVNGNELGMVRAQAVEICAVCYRHKPCKCDGEKIEGQTGGGME